MSFDRDDRFPPFFIGDHDRLTIRFETSQKAYRLIQTSHDSVILKAEEGPRLCETFTFRRLRELERAGKIRHEVEYFLPPEMRSPPARSMTDMAMPRLNPKHRARVDLRYAYAQALIDLQNNPDEEQRVGKGDEHIAANMEAIRKAAAEYLRQDLPAPEEEENLRLVAEGRKRKPRSYKPVALPPEVHPTTLRKWASLLRRGGKPTLIDKCANRGNRKSYFTPEENALLMKAIKDSYLTLKRPPISVTVRHVKIAFTDENKRRVSEGLGELRVPGRDAVRACIKRLDELTVAIARYGRKEALKRFTPVGRGLEVLRPLERCEMDEQQIDLMSIMAKAGLLALFTEEELDVLGLDDKKGRWWLVVVIDCRTRVILGMKLTNNPRSSAAMECLRMAVSDKGDLVNAVGGRSVWPSGKPEMLVTDNGVFRSTVFTNCCTDLDIALMRTIGGSPSMRPRNERWFLTHTSGLPPLLEGRTFASAAERGDYAAEDRACLDAEDICTVLVRWIVDVYHNTPHTGLGGRTPLEQWEHDHLEGNLSLCALPDQHRKRLAFGLSLDRTLGKDGLTVLGVRYHCEELARLFMARGKQVLEIRWDHTDIGAIGVDIDGTWLEVPAVFEMTDEGTPFDGLHAQEWLAARRALRSRSERRKAWNEEVVLEAITAIRGLNTARRLEHKLIDTPWDAAKMKHLDQTLFAGFSVTANARKTRAAEDGYGRVIEPRAPEPEAPGADLAPLPTETAPKPARPVRKADLKIKE